MFVPDAQGPSTCADDCLAAWPALTGPATAGEGVDAALLGTAPRPDDGSEQVTYNGWPLYYFAQDAAPGDVNGQGVGDIWYVVDPTGTPIAHLSESHAASTVGGRLHAVARRAAPVASPGGMATLRFSFGTMGSGKSTVALQIHHNLSSRDLYGLLLTCLDREGDQVTSRLGVAAPAIDVTPDLDLHTLAVAPLADPLPRVRRGAVLHGRAVRPARPRRRRAGGRGVRLRVDHRLPRRSCSRAPSGCSRSPTSGCRCRSRRAAGAAPGRRTTPASSTARSSTRARRSSSATPRPDDPAAVRRRRPLRAALPPPLPPRRTRHLNACPELRRGSDAIAAAVDRDQAAGSDVSPRRRGGA